VKLTRTLIAVLVLISSVACTREPPAYESRATEPSATTTSAPVKVDALWSDTFDRPDTQSGLGEGWDMRAGYVDRYPMPAATDGYLRDGVFTYAGDDTVYATRRFPNPVQEIGTTGRWRKARDGAETTIAMAISSNDKLVNDMVHFAANRSTWELTVRRGGPFEPVAKGRFDPPLSMDRDYTFAMRATPTDITVEIPGADPITTPVDTAGLTGEWVFWEEYIKPPPAGTVFDFDTVWVN
jgi:hypothetical protein